MSWTTPASAPAGGDLTSAFWNEQVRDNLAAIGSAWTAYSPSWTAATMNPSVNDGTITGRYLSAGKLVMFSVEIVMGALTSYGSGIYSLSLPVAARSSSSRRRFDGILYDASSGGGSVTGSYPLVGVLSTSTTVELGAWPVTAGNTFRALNATNVVTLDNGDRITIAGTYEAA